MHGLKAHSFKVKELIDAKRLYIVDYQILAGIVEPESAGYYQSSAYGSNNIFYAPYVLLYT